MWDAALHALGVFADPHRLWVLLVGVLAVYVVGMIPGLGGVEAVSVLLPIIFRFDAPTALAALTGALAVVYTSDTITSVLVGTPGSPASGPTAIEGHALARRGQAARALSAAFLSSAVGGMLGVIGLTLAIPVARPLVMLLGSPELFMFTVLGLAYSGSLLGASPIKGLLSGLLGLLLGLVGPSPAAAQFRYTFDHPYLLDGISLEVLALGIFGIAEITSLLARGGAIAREAPLGAGWLEGVRDVLRHRWLLLRGSLIGVWAGVLPAIGATAAAWMSYGHAVATTPDRSRFGKGEIRGVIAPESANNAATAGDLIPTLLFSVPGGPAAAVILGALYAYGIYPGPRLVEQHLDLVYVIVWSFALANILGAILAFSTSPLVARLTHIRFALVAPPLLVTMVLSAYQTTRHSGDLLALFALGILGWLMKAAGWPRAPLLVGFVLARPMERYFWLTVELHGWRWLTYPGVLAIAALMVGPTLWSLLRDRREASSRRAKGKPEGSVPGALLAILAAVLFGYGLWEARTYEWQARLLPMVASAPGLILALVQAPLALRGEVTGSELEAPPGRELVQLLVIGAYLGGCWLVGYFWASLLYLLAFLRYAARLQPAAALSYTLAGLAVLWGIIRAFGLAWPSGAVLR